MRKNPNFDDILLYMLKLIMFKKFSLLFLLLPSFLLGKIDFVHEIMPVLKKHCAECHTGDKKKGGLSMNTRAAFLAGGENGKVAIPGKPADSFFLELIQSEDSDERMPPKGDGLSADEIKKLTVWVTEGMPWDEGIRLSSSGWEPPLKPRVVKLPEAHKDRDHPIDRLLDSYLAKNKRPIPHDSEDPAFVRRAYLDMVGLLPSPAQLKEFSTSKSANKREELIDALLADDVAYADHWLTFWNDLLRNDYTGTGFITGGRKQITTWLYAALRENKPYDQFVKELIDAKGEASGFINGIKWRGNVSAGQTVHMQFSQNVSQVFLGINMKCASCHDSFIDRWTLEEAYNLASIYADKPLELTRCDKPTGKMSTAKWIFPELGEVDPKASKTERLKQLAGLMTHPENGRFTRTIVNRIWARLMGRGIVHPVDAMHTKPWNVDLLDYLAVRFAEDGYDLRKFIGFVMTSRAYQSKTVFLSEEPSEDYVYSGPVPKRMTAEQFIDSIWQVTGTNPTKIEAKVDRASRHKPEPAGKDTAKSGRKGPLKARYVRIINQTPGQVLHLAEVEILQGDKNLALAGKATQVDTGYNGFAKLAIDGNRNGDFFTGKSVTHTSSGDGPWLEIDLGSEQAIDRIMVFNRMDGPTPERLKTFWIVAMDAKREPVWAHLSRKIPKPKWEGKLPKTHERLSAADKKVLASYGKSGPAFTATSDTPSIRAALVKNDFLMRSLGRPHRDQVVTSRPAELTTLQAIDLANGQILANYLARGAKTLGAQKKPTPERIDWLFSHAFSRQPSPAERSLLAGMIPDSPTSKQMEDLLWMVFMHPEFQIIR
jgi:hypothetical protein